MRNEILFPKKAQPISYYFLLAKMAIWVCNLYIMKKTSTKKAVAKSTKTVAKKAVAKKTGVKAPAKKPVAKKACACGGKTCKTNPSKKCCGKKDCKCGKVYEKQVAEVFGQLSDIVAVENLMKDYFFTELLKRGVNEEEANAKANALIINVEAFEANIDIPEE